MHDLGLTKDQFESLTASDFHELLARHNQAEKRADVRFGLLATMIASIFPPKSGQVTQPGEWFGHKIEEAPLPTEEELTAKIIAIFEPMVAETARKKALQNG